MLGNDEPEVKEDPLDYLARFCILTPSALKQYGRVFDKVTGTKDRTGTIDLCLVSLPLCVGDSAQRAHT
jgi:hypothetical protein